MADGAGDGLRVELADILGEELALPNIEDKGKSRIVNQRDRYVGVRRVGPNSLRHFRRTYREALKSAMAEEMERDERIVILGEDIGLYGGTHLVTDGLLDRFEAPLVEVCGGLGVTPAKLAQWQREFGIG